MGRQAEGSRPWGPLGNARAWALSRGPGRIGHRLVTVWAHSRHARRGADPLKGQRWRPAKRTQINSTACNFVGTRHTLVAAVTKCAALPRSDQPFLLSSNVPTRSAHERRLAHLEALCRELEELRREARELCDALAREIAHADEVNRFVSDGFDRPKVPRPARPGVSAAGSKAKKAPNSAKKPSKAAAAGSRARTPRAERKTAARTALGSHAGEAEVVASRNYANEGDG